MSDSPEKNTPGEDSPGDDREKEFVDPPSGPWGTRESIQKGGGGGRKPSLTLHEGVIPLDQLLHLMAVAVCGESEPIEPSALLAIANSMKDLLDIVPATRLFGMFTLQDLRERFKGRKKDLDEIEEILASLPPESETSVGNVATGLFEPLYANKEMEYRDEVDQWIASGELKIRKLSTGGIYSPADYAHRWHGDPLVLVDEDLQEFLRDRGIELKIRPPLEPETEQSEPGVTDLPRDGAAWELHEPKRHRPYTKDVYDILKEAYDAGERRPSPRDVLELWRDQPPGWAVEVLEDEVKYNDGNGDLKFLDLKSLGGVIREMTKTKSY